MNTNIVCAYDELNFDGLERRGNYRFIAFREDILHALDKKEAAAIIFQIVYRWQTEYKRNEVLKLIEERKKTGLKPYTPEEIEDLMFVYMSYNDFVRESGGALGYNTVIRILKYLIDEKKVLIQRENHDPRFGDYEYSINKDVARQLLKALPVEPAFSPKMPRKKAGSTQMGTPNDSSTHLGTPAQESTQMGTGSTQMGTEVYPNGSTSQELTRTHKNERTNGTLNETNHSSTLSLSSLAEKSERIAQLLEEARRLEEEMQQAASESVEHLSTELSPSVEKPLPIASPTTENAEPRTVRKTDELQPALNLEEVRARGYWNRLGFIEKAASAKHWKTLAEHTKTFEQFESLFEYTRVQIEKDPRITKKEVNPGNMVREITGWKQEENRKLAQRVQPEQTRPMSLAERNREKMRLAGMIVPAVTGRN